MPSLAFRNSTADKLPSRVSAHILCARMLSACISVASVPYLRVSAFICVKKTKLHGVKRGLKKNGAVQLWLDKNRLPASGPLKSTVVRIWYRTPSGRPHKVDFVSLACLPSVFVQFFCSVRHFFTRSQFSRGAFPLEAPQMDGD